MDAPERERSAAPQESALSFQCHEEVVARLSQLYGDTRHADVTFVVQRDEASLPQRFPAHRSLVAAWSQPLESMLCGAFAEGGAKEVRLLDVEPAAFEVLLPVWHA
ncbi:unnamed protein product [Effrenium voratum]|uniref:BTB domain-containing protein n=1 Tax=Effrenium voratum TaxID=2562239 RepID=A0AA36IDE7_9DINO|nr:unnamed protein product [Effrenium voratum]